MVRFRSMPSISFLGTRHSLIFTLGRESAASNKFGIQFFVVFILFAAFLENMFQVGPGKQVLFLIDPHIENIFQYPFGDGCKKRQRSG